MRVFVRDMPLWGSSEQHHEMYLRRDGGGCSDINSCTFIMKDNAMKDGTMRLTIYIEGGGQNPNKMYKRIVICSQPLHCLSIVVV